MTRALTLLLLAILAVPLHAQVCSGGSGGGVDATGNQCSDGATSASGAGASEPEFHLLSAKMSGSEHRGAAPAGPQLSAKLSATLAAPAAVSQGKSRFIKVAASPHAPVHTSKIEEADAPACSGGADGGTDATGNQCGTYPAAGLHATGVGPTKH
jgi:hypothetical protein